MQPPTLKPGDVVIAYTRGILAAKRRPTVVVSTDLFLAHHPDVTVAFVTTQMHQATTPTDYILKDWAAAGLRQPSVVRMFLETVVAADTVHIGRLSDRDWQEVQARLRL